MCWYMDCVACTIMNAALDSVQCNTKLLRYSMNISSDKHWSVVINASLSDAKHYLTYACEH
jgi:hypothetical protein